MKVIEYWVDNYHTLTVQTTVNDTEESDWCAVTQSLNVGKCKVKATIIHQQRMVGYLEALKQNGSLGGEFIYQLRDYKKRLYVLSNEYPEKTI